MKKILLFLLPMILIFGCSKQKDKEWTIMVYMAADNGLIGSALEDLEDMKSAVFSDKINLIVQIDYDIYSEYSAHRYEITPQNQNFISSLGEIDSGDYNLLTNFVNWSSSNYPADRYALFVWSHGNGWYSDENAAFCSDNESGNYFNIPDGDLNNAFKNMNMSLDMLIFDACNMQTIEVATEIDRYIDYMIGSEAGINCDGFPYKEILTEWENFSETRNLAMEIAFQYHKYYYFNNDPLLPFPFSCSVIEMQKFSELEDKLQEFTASWTAQAQDSIFTNSRNACLEFNETAFSSLPADVDLKEFFVNVADQSVCCANYELSIFSQNMLSLIDSVFIFQETGIYPTNYPSEDIGTALIWFPDQETLGIFNERKEAYEKLEFNNTQWLNFLVNFLDQ